MERSCGSFDNELGGFSEFVNFEDFGDFGDFAGNNLIG